MSEREARDKRCFKAIRFLMITGRRLKVRSQTLATAAAIYHTTNELLSSVDTYLLATTSVYLAGKAEDDHVRLRDVINSAYRSLHPDRPALDIGSKYWKLRESVVQCELLLLRAVNFELTFDHPHKWLLHYLKAISDWLKPEENRRFPLARTAWAILEDCYHGRVCLENRPQHVAVAIIYLTLQCYGLEIIGSDTKQWWQVMADGIDLEVIRTIIEHIFDIYDLEKTTSSAGPQTLLSDPRKATSTGNRESSPSSSDKSSSSSSDEEKSPVSKHPPEVQRTPSM